VGGQSIAALLNIAKLPEFLRKSANSDNDRVSGA
jgi:hypothetical protein